MNNVCSMIKYESSLSLTFSSKKLSTERFHLIDWIILAKLKILDFENDEFRVCLHVSAGRIANGAITRTLARHSQLSNAGKGVSSLKHT